ncbi:MAG: hypothetical protein EOO38_23045 [Cytophagaceae bacterium]|nr:MAG: hypothetical protein EOO38_23045 [Cytophagaceae bacterium]
MPFHKTLSFELAKKVAKAGLQVTTSLSYLSWPGQKEAARLETSHALSFATGQTNMKIIPAPDIDELYPHLPFAITHLERDYSLVHFMINNYHVFKYIDANLMDTSVAFAESPSMVDAAAMLFLNLHKTLSDERNKKSAA